MSAIYSLEVFQEGQARERFRAKAHEALDWLLDGLETPMADSGARAPTLMEITEAVSQTLEPSTHPAGAGKRKEAAKTLEQAIALDQSQMMQALAACDQHPRITRHKATTPKSPLGTTAPKCRRTRALNPRRRR